MITTSTQCPIAQSIFAEINFHLAIAASFDGYWQAKLLIDDEHQPRSACLMLPPRAYLAGSTENRTFNTELAAIIEREYPPDRDALFFYDLPQWVEVLENLLTGRTLVNGIREHYSRTPAPTDWQSRTPQDIRLTWLGVDLVTEKRFTHQDRLIAEIESSNPSLDAFLEHQFGVCALQDATLAGWCLSENVSDNRCEIGIETVEPFQRRGIATAMTLRFVELAHEIGIKQIGWDCWKRNTASGSTAIKAGFRKESEYPVLLALGSEQ